MTQKLSKNKHQNWHTNIQNESCSTTWVDPKTVFEPFHSPKNKINNKNKKYTLATLWFFLEIFGLGDRSDCRGPAAFSGKAQNIMDGLACHPFIFYQKPMYIVKKKEDKGRDKKKV